MTKYLFSFSAKEIIESNRTTAANIDNVRLWLTSQALPQLTDEQIAAFLLSCDNNEDMTRKTITSNYQLKCKFPELFTNRYLQDEKIAKILRVVDGCEILVRHNGCAIILVRFNDTNYKNFDFFFISFWALMKKIV